MGTKVDGSRTDRQVTSCLRVSGIQLRTGIVDGHNTRTCSMNGRDLEPKKVNIPSLLIIIIILVHDKIYEIYLIE